jgi:hypothetical protein
VEEALDQIRRVEGKRREHTGEGGGEEEGGGGGREGEAAGVGEKEGG